MKIAIPLNEKKTISRHFGRSPYFYLVTADEGIIASKEIVDNVFTHHVAEGCHGPGKGEQAQGHGRGAGSGKGQGQGAGQGHGMRNHEGIMNFLSDVDVVIAGGLGQRMYDDLCTRIGKVYVVKESNPDFAIQQLMAGKLETASGRICESTGRGMK